MSFMLTQRRREREEKLCALLRICVKSEKGESTAPVHKKQLLTYLRLADKRLGLLINFGEELLKDGLARVVNGLDEE